MKKISFVALLSEAWRATFSKKAPWIFGFFIALSGVLMQTLSENFLSINSYEGLLQFISQKTSGELWTASLVVFSFFLINVFGTGNLISSLAFMIKEPGLSQHLFHPRTLWKNFLHTLTLECLTLLFLLLLLGILSLPLLIALEINPSAMPLLQSLALLIFFPLLFLLALIKKFSLLYLLLSPLRLRPAIETACTLFSRFFTASLSFFFSVFILVLLFTFSVNIVILVSTVFFENIGISTIKLSISFVISVLFFLWFSVFEQALWIAFFKSIAGPRVTKKITKDEESLIEENVLVETPFVQ